MSPEETQKQWFPDPAERAYRRGVSHGLAAAQRLFEELGDDLAAAVLESLLVEAQLMRFDARPHLLYIDELAERRRGQES